MPDHSTKKIIIGAGRQAEETFGFYQDYTGNDDVIAFAVDEPQRGQQLAGKPVISINEVISGYRDNQPSVLVAIGDVAINKRLTALFRQAGFSFFNVIHPGIVEHRQRMIGEGVTIAPGTILTCNVSVGNHVLINIGCTISHDCVIGDYVNISPGSHLAGRVQIEEEVFVGIGASFIPGVKVGKGSIIAAGACVTRDVPSNCMVAGVPATVRKKLR